jgi:hypothetical protein
MICHSCASRNPGCFVPAAGFLLGKRQREDIFWIPAFAGMTPFSRFRLPSAGFSHRGTGVGKQTRRLRYGEAPLDVIPTKVGIQ